MDSDRIFWVRIWQTVLTAFVLVIWGLLAFNAAQMRTLVAGGYCERYDKNTWIKCDLLDQVVIK